MKLYELPRYTYFRIDEGELLNHEHQEVYFFDHLDGMYSFCRDKDNQIVHFSVVTPVIPDSRATT